MPASSWGRQNPVADPAQWVGGSQDDPVLTPQIPPLWSEPDPPLINTQPQPPDPMPPTSSYGGQTITMHPNDRNPVTGAPVWNAGKPPGPLPPGRASIVPNGTMPITGAPIWFPPPSGTMSAPLRAVPPAKPIEAPPPMPGVNTPPADRIDHQPPPLARPSN